MINSRGGSVEYALRVEFLHSRVSCHLDMSHIISGLSCVLFYLLLHLPQLP